MTPDRRSARPRAGSSASREFIAAVNSDSPELTTEAPEKQAAHQRSSSFARDIMFAEFGYRAGRAIDYDGFTDRQPAAASQWWRAAS